MNLLFIDDVLINLKMAKYILSEHVDNIFLAGTVEEARKIAQNKQIDFIISDIEMIHPKTKINQNLELISFIEEMMAKKINVAFHTSAGWEDYPELKGIKFIKKGNFGDMKKLIKLPESKSVSQKITPSQRIKLLNPEYHVAYSPKKILYQALKNWDKLNLKNKEQIFYNFKLTQLQKEIKQKGFTKKQLDQKIVEIKKLEQKLNQFSNFKKEFPIKKEAPKVKSSFRRK